MKKIVRKQSFAFIDKMRGRHIRLLYHPITPRCFRFGFDHRLTTAIRWRVQV